MRMLKQVFMLTILLAVTSACNLVNFQPEVQAVELRSAADVTDCKLLGTTNEKTSDRWASARNDKKIATELLTRARNEAVSLGGNTVVEKTELVMGQQTFEIYSCS